MLLNDSTLWFCEQFFLIGQRGRPKPGPTAQSKPRELGLKARTTCFVPPSTISPTTPPKSQSLQRLLFKDWARYFCLQSLQRLLLKDCACSFCLQSLPSPLFKDCACYFCLQSLQSPLFKDWSRSFCLQSLQRPLFKDWARIFCSLSTQRGWQLSHPRCRAHMVLPTLTN